MVAAAQRRGPRVTSPGLRRTANHPKVHRHIKAITAAALAVTLAIAAGCKQYEEVYAVSFRNGSGAELAAGTISLSGPVPAAGLIRGRYKLQLTHVQSTTKETEVFYQLFGGKESGRIEWTVGAQKAGVSSSTFDFMPGSADANVIAYAMPTLKGHWRGRWSYALFTSGREGGSFEVSRK
jgi:hypothetical protein